SGQPHPLDRGRHPGEMAPKGHEWQTRRQPALQLYSDFAITVCRSLGIVMRLPLRQSSGLVGSLLALAKLDLPVPDYSPLSRRSRTLAIDLGVARSANSERSRHLVI